MKLPGNGWGLSGLSFWTVRQDCNHGDGGLITPTADVKPLCVFKCPHVLAEGNKNLFNFVKPSAVTSNALGSFFCCSSAVYSHECTNQYLVEYSGMIL